MSYTWLMSKDKMFVNGVSSDTVGIYVDTPPMPPMAEEIVETLTVYGRAEQQTYRTGNYKDVTITVNCYIFDYGNHPDAIYRYLSGAKTLSFSSAGDYYYKVKHVAGITPTYAGNGKNQIAVQFVCSPFKYTANNPAIVYDRGEDDAKTIHVLNAGTIYSEPLLVMGCTRDVPGEFQVIGHLTVNGIEVEVPQTIQGDVYFDLQSMIIYFYYNGVKSWVRNVSGNWWDFILVPGYNEITFSGSPTLTVTKNERFL